MLKSFAFGAALMLALPVAASAVTINFDDISAPFQFTKARPLILQYGSLGVAFSGTGAVLDESVADFVTSGGSAPNLVGYANLQQIGGTFHTSATSDTIRFSLPQTSVSFDVGSYSPLSLGITLFDAAGATVGNQLVALTSALQTVTLTGSFSSIGLNLVGARESDAFALDNLTFAQGAAIVAAPEPMAMGLLAIGIGGVLGLRRRVR